MKKKTTSKKVEPTKGKTGKHLKNGHLGPLKLANSEKTMEEMVFEMLAMDEVTLLKWIIKRRRRHARYALNMQSKLISGDKKIIQAFAEGKGQNSKVICTLKALEISKDIIDFLSPIVEEITNHPPKKITDPVVTRSYSPKQLISLATAMWHLGAFETGASLGILESLIVFAKKTKQNHRRGIRPKLEKVKQKKLEIAADFDSRWEKNLSKKTPLSKNAIIKLLIARHGKKESTVKAAIRDFSAYS